MLVSSSSMPGEHHVDRKINLYKVFLIVALPLGIAAVILDMRFSGDETLGWISNVSQVTLLVIGVIGAIAGWRRYLIQGHSPFEDLRRWLNRWSPPGKENELKEKDPP